MDGIDEKKNLIKDCITKEECEYMCDDTLFNCDSCSSCEECYTKSCQRCNDTYAKSINYGGYNTEEDFWEQI